MLRGREVGTNMEHMLQEQYLSWCRRKGYASFLGCSGDSLQEQCTRRDITYWCNFVPALSQLNFIRVAVQFSARQRNLLAHYRETPSCPRNMRPRVCRSLVSIHSTSSTRQWLISNYCTYLWCPSPSVWCNSSFPCTHPFFYPASRCRYPRNYRATPPPKTCRLSMKIWSIFVR